MFINNFDPVAVQFFSIEIRWYSLAYIIGIVLGWILSKKFFILDNEIKEKFDDYITYLILGIIIGGRLGYVIFYNFEYFSSNFIDVFKVWQGGMSFHGGLLGIIFISIWFAKKNNHNLFKYLDVVAIVAPVGIFFGRIANFINSELYGIETSVPWAVKFVQIDNLYRHPSQIYEAILEGLILFSILIFIYLKKNYRVGICSYAFLFFYGIFRIISEFFREPDVQLGYLFGSLTMGMLLSALMIIFGVILYRNKNEL